MHLDFKIFLSSAELPDNWDNLAAPSLFLTRSWFRIMDESKPVNMRCFANGLYRNEELAGCAIAQYLNLETLESFGDRDRCMKTMVRDFAFRNFASGVLFIGNNMLTGQNAYVAAEGISPVEVISALKKASEYLVGHLKKQGKKVHLVSFKDFYSDEADILEKSVFPGAYRFSTQPNMVLSDVSRWNTTDDYLSNLNKKYRDQFKRARKKIALIDRQELSFEEIAAQEDRIYALYDHVARNAPFNTFFLHKKHFSEMKKQFGEKFRLFAYYLGGKMIGFMTLIENGKSLDTYFLGYDEGEQKEHMLYLNMLYDMLFFAIENQFREIIFARTALEIKSSIGAEPVDMFGFITHRYPVIQKGMGHIFPRLEPKQEWIKRHPFK